ncbi:virulence factor TspB C-terminal domain-related protein [Acinetobacter colistiniresistens]|uniref:virulence factor TspB C-terminal domain-related protein n=2 Tax=Acinetobacter colistiniresistens TaxID=280145 RepID=UPI000E5C17FA|nr:virulence factor TspB C-terminal domain-related protein [Acinetobacter colistiniresistens]
MRYLLLFLCLVFSTLGHTRSDWVFPSENGMIEYDPVQFKSAKKLTDLGSLISSSCPRSDEGCYSCPYSAKVVIVWDFSQYVGKCFACPVGAGYFIEGKKVPDLTGEPVAWSCGNQFCADGFTLDSNAGYNRECYKKIPCADDRVWDPKNKVCQMKVCPTGTYRAEDYTCRIVPTCSHSEQLTFSDHYDGYSYRKYFCIPIVCAPGEQLTNGECMPVYPVCGVDEKFIDGKCVAPKSECEISIIGSVKCLKQSVVESLNNVNSGLNAEYDNHNNVLQNVIDALDGRPTGGGDGGDNGNTDHGDYDVGELKADTPFRSLNESFFNDSLFKNNPHCPADRTLDVWGTNYSFSYLKLCSVLDKLSYLVLILSFVAAAYIIWRD